MLDSGLAMAGIATALAIEPALPRQWQAGQDSTAELPPIRWKRKALASLAYMAAVKAHPAWRKWETAALAEPWVVPEDEP